MVRGWISDVDPLTFDDGDVVGASNGLTLFLCQILIILALCTILGQVFRLINQPIVVGELLAGVVLGPTAFGNIPGFAAKITPANAMPLLTLTSNIGLIFFILIVGLETDSDLIKKNLKKVTLIAVPGMAVPFAISVGLARFVYEKSTDESQTFTTFFLFLATVMAVTSLSVLSRVLSEMHLVRTLLGSVTLAAGALNDLIGYILLALGSALAGGGRQINALIQLAVALAMFLTQWFIIRPLLFWMIERSTFQLHGDGKQRVPHHLLCFALLGAMVSAFITEACGLHPILGSLLFGIACPHGNFATRISEELELLAVKVLLPLYFVTSGLKADFKTLNTGLIWGQLILIFVVVYISKFTTTTICTRIAGFSWRESAFVAALMQSKSIIELIILNAGREANVLSSQVYSMLFVTFILSTLTVRPLSGYIKSHGQGIGTMKADDDSATSTSPDQAISVADVEKDESMSDVAKMARLPVMSLTAALASANPPLEGLTAMLKCIGPSPISRPSAITLEVIRFLPLVNSASDILRQMSQEGDQILGALQLLARMYRTPLKVPATDSNMIELAETPQDIIDRIVKRATSSSDRYGLIMVPWEKNAHLSVLDAEDDDVQVGETSRWSRLPHSETTAAFLFHHLPASMNAGVLLDGSVITRKMVLPSWKSIGSESDLLSLLSKSRKPRLFVAFFGGSDDRKCVEVAQAVALNGNADAVIVTTSETGNVQSVTTPDELEERSPDVSDSLNQTANMMTVNVPAEQVEAERQADVRTVFGAAQEATSLPSQEQTQRSISRRDGLIHVTLSAEDIRSTTTGTAVEATLRYIAGYTLSQCGDVLLVGRGKRQQRTMAFRSEVDEFIGTCGSTARATEAAGEAHMLSHIRSVLGSSCEAVCSSGLSANVLVVQSGRE